MASLPISAPAQRPQRRHFSLMPILSTLAVVGLGGLAAHGALRQGQVNSMEAQQVQVLQEHLGAIGVDVVVEAPKLEGASAEWDAQARTIRVAPATVSQGNALMLTALNHEAIHVAQTCKAGGFDQQPSSLGMVNGPVPEALQSPVYRGADAHTLELETEAYGLQQKPGIGVQLVGRYCHLG